MATDKSTRSQFRKKRSDTKISTIEKQYGKDFGVRSDAKLGNYLQNKGYKSLGELLRNEQTKTKKS